MNQGPLTEKELNWLEDMLEKYGNEQSVVDTSELDGMLTALLSGPNDIEPSEWLVALWGDKKHIPKWANERQMDRYMTQIFQHFNDIAKRLDEFPEPFDPGRPGVHCGGRLVLWLSARRGVRYGLGSTAGEPATGDGCN